MRLYCKVYLKKIIIKYFLFKLKDFLSFFLKDLTDPKLLNDGTF